MKSNLDRRKCIHGIHRHISDMNVGTVADCTDTRGRRFPIKGTYAQRTLGSRTSEVTTIPTELEGRSWTLTVVGETSLSMYLALEVRLIETTVKASHPHCFIDQ